MIDGYMLLSYLYYGWYCMQCNSAVVYNVELMNSRMNNVRWLGKLLVLYAINNAGIIFYAST
ncbi:hypothetical protein GGS24DRAFT_268051 [Hypoxylon argillaceum]|nr:hypothetical protein GGS24DRAFT_268051 [Hypoxylon argillaceum]